MTDDDDVYDDDTHRVFLEVLLADLDHDHELASSIVHATDAAHLALYLAHQFTSLFVDREKLRDDLVHDLALFEEDDEEV